MKTEIHNKKKHLLIPLGIICLFGVIYAQDSKPKPKVTPQPAVTTKPPASKTTTTKATSVTTNNKYGTVTDIDGNVYKTVKIGNQIWMAENLKTTRYNDGTPILYISKKNEWDKCKIGAYCFSQNDYNSNETNGKLYNWYAVGTGKLAPKGWHIPSDDDWSDLIYYLGGTDKAGAKMKNTIGWKKLDLNLNESGFQALPSGYRISDVFYDNSCIWWSSTEINANKAWSLELNYYDNDIKKGVNDTKDFGFSVRCLKD